MPGPLLGWLGANALGLLGAGGAIAQNVGSARAAGSAQRFAERMSSTSAQRAVADYTKAGLNPALAYDRPASSPGGSVAQVQDIAEKGISSGLAASQAKANIALTRAQTNKATAEAESASVDAGLKSGRVVRPDGTPSYVDEMLRRRQDYFRDSDFHGRLQPHDQRLKSLERLFRELEEPERRFKSNNYRAAGAVQGYIRDGLSSAGAAYDAFKAWGPAVESHARGYSDSMSNAAEAFRAWSNAAESKARGFNDAGWKEFGYTPAGRWFRDKFKR